MTIKTEEPVLSALFVDFDNIYISLQEQSRHIANQFANNPDTWLNWLEKSMQNGVERRILIRKCYLNPQRFSEFRPYFIRSAFEVVDCPPLTARGKTSTDIHLVMDVLDALNHPTNFKEFIILSGDSDFTPVLLRLRMYNRWTSVLPIGYVSPAYKSSCDFLISQDDFVRDGLGINLQDEEPLPTITADPQVSKLLLEKMANRLYDVAIQPQGIEASTLPKVYAEFPEFTRSSHWLGYQSLRGLTEALVKARSDLTIKEEDPWRVCRLEAVDSNGQSRNMKEAIAMWIRNIVSESPSAVTMAALADGVVQQFGVEIRSSNWLGAESFKGLLSELDLGNLMIGNNIPGYVYDPGHHALSSIATSADDVDLADSLMPPVGKFSLNSPPMASLAWKINQLTDTPYLMPEHYAIVFQEIAREINENQDYQWTRTSKTVRDRCVEKGVPVGRSHINFILTGLYYSGYPLGKEIPVDVSKLSKTMIENTIGLCRNAQFQLNDAEIKLLTEWMDSSNKLEPL